MLTRFFNAWPKRLPNKPMQRTGLRPAADRRALSFFIEIEHGRKN
jgi:hypothetical protein